MIIYITNRQEDLEKLLTNEYIATNKHQKESPKYEDTYAYTGGLIQVSCPILLDV